MAAFILHGYMNTHAEGHLLMFQTLKTNDSSEPVLTVTYDRLAFLTLLVRRLTVGDCTAGFGRRAFQEVGQRQMLESALACFNCSEDQCVGS